MKKAALALILLLGGFYYLTSKATRTYKALNGKFVITHLYEKNFNLISFPGGGGCPACTGEIIVKGPSNNIIFQSNKNIVGLDRKPIIVFMKNKLYLRHYDLDEGFVKLIDSSGKDIKNVELSDFTDFYQQYVNAKDKKYGSENFNFTVKSNKISDLNLKRTLVEFVKRVVVRDQDTLNSMIKNHIKSKTKADLYFAIALGHLLVPAEKTILTSNIKVNSTFKSLKYDSNINDLFEHLAANLH